ncbi:glycosyltransferase [Ramlibacter sp. MAHUQ-53]|uniref:glycosyltransferase n=1 Tax=unclassified Ramlibacter TaxID=2617605 RepID=UPI003625B154
MEHLVAFSHLRWNFVWQRPQHLLSRLARRWPVVFVEEPVACAERAWLERITPCAGVQVWRPHVTGAAPGFHDDHLATLQPMLGQALREARIEDYRTWFYTPMAYPLAADLSPRAVVYDCMDELSAFRHAPRQLLQRESALFKAADLVFTGGPSLFHAKKDRHPSVHCFPSSVDADHFARAAGDHPLQAGLPRPRLGWAGVIDERVDLDLIAFLADARPDWQLVMVGPVVKIDPATLPQRTNIAWLGQQAYDDLPAFISGWDLCLLPFALNEATRFISPTKTLEYMACGKPAVSTPIRDVAEPYGHLVSIANAPDDFLLACEAVLGRSEAEQACHAEAMAQVVGRTSWEGTAQAMAGLVARAGMRGEGSGRRERGEGGPPRRAVAR